jgi:alanine racemase
LAYITLNKQNFFHNLNVCLEKTKDRSKIAIVLKDNAYGHGLVEIATMAKEYGLKKAVVRTLNEATKIEKFFEQILILADITNESLSHTFHITINKLDDIDVLAPNTNIHIKINTGMYRNGIEEKDLEVAIYRALEKNLNICGFFTHHKSADELGNEFFIQNQAFKKIKSQIFKICEKLNLSNIQLHSCNSAALFRIKNFDEDFARIGIAVYGYHENHPSLSYPNLKPVLSLYANQISSRTLPKNKTIGYGGKYRSDKIQVVSTYDIGYADGFHRIPDGKIYKIDETLQILGRVSMDNLSINSNKKEICLFDNVKPLAKLHNTISYEMLTSLKSGIKRVIV